MTAVVAVYRALRVLLWTLIGLLICAVAFPVWRLARRRRCIEWWSRCTLAALGIGLELGGQPSSGTVMVAANHVSWIDILALNATRAMRFVSKAEIRRWPLIGWMTACGGTLFIERTRRKDAMRVVHAIADALRCGDTVAVFPEGTVGDGLTLLPFHANLFEAAIASGTPVQPVAIRYTDDASRKRGAATRVVAFEGAITLTQTLLRVLCAKGLVVSVKALPPIATALDRRSLAAEVERAVGTSLGLAIVEPPTH